MHEFRFTRPHEGHYSSPVSRNGHLDVQRKELENKLTRESIMIRGCQNHTERSPSATSCGSSVPSTVIRRSMTNTPLSSVISADRPVSSSKEKPKKTSLDDMNSDSFSDSGAEFPEVQVLVDGDGSPIPDSEAPRQSLSRPSTVRSDQARSNRVGWSPFPPINSMKSNIRDLNPNSSQQLSCENASSCDPAKHEGNPVRSFSRFSGFGMSAKKDSDRPRSTMMSFRKVLANVFGGSSKSRRSKVQAFDGPAGTGEEFQPAYRTSKRTDTIGSSGLFGERNPSVSSTKKRTSLRDKTLRTSRSEFPLPSTSSPLNTKMSSDSVKSHPRSQRRPTLPFVDSSNYAARSIQLNAQRNDELLSPTKVVDKHALLMRRVSVLQKQLQMTRYELMMIEQNGPKGKPGTMPGRPSGLDQTDGRFPNELVPMPDFQTGYIPNDPNLLYPGKEQLRSSRSAYTLRPKQSETKFDSAVCTSLPKTVGHCRLGINGEDGDKRTSARQSIQSFFYPNGLSDGEALRRSSQTSAASSVEHRGDGPGREAAYRALSGNFDIPCRGALSKESLHRGSSPVRYAQIEGSFGRTGSPVRKTAINLGKRLSPPSLDNAENQAWLNSRKPPHDPHCKQPFNEISQQIPKTIATSVPSSGPAYDLPTLFDPPRQKPLYHASPTGHPISVVPGRTSTESVPPLPPLPKLELIRGNDGLTRAQRAHNCPLQPVREPRHESLECL